VKREEKVNLVMQHSMHTQHYVQTRFSILPVTFFLPFLLLLLLEPIAIVCAVDLFIFHERKKSRAISSSMRVREKETNKQLVSRGI
jgi:hypothetical protein